MKWRETRNLLLECYPLKLFYYFILISFVLLCNQKCRFIYIRICFTHFLFLMCTSLYNFAFCRSFLFYCFFYKVCTFIIPYFTTRIHFTQFVIKCTYFYNCIFMDVFYSLCCHIAFIFANF